MLRYTAGECNYGGKVTLPLTLQFHTYYGPGTYIENQHPLWPQSQVTDGNDRRTLMTLIDAFYSEETAAGAEGVPLSASGTYVVPPLGEGHT